tara:strand:+ start:96 stop:206 length:111 start_codon:yes stop_codon:yes gene_type:complete
MRRVILIVKYLNNQRRREERERSERERETGAREGER